MIALDGSASMIEHARSRLGRGPGGVRRGRPAGPAADRPAGGRDPVDGDVPLDRGPRRACSGGWPAVLLPGGQLAAQCGGAGNIASIEAALPTWARTSRDASTSRRRRRPARRLERAGFVDVECWLTDEPSPVPDDGPRALPGGDLPGRPRRWGWIPGPGGPSSHEVASRMAEPVIDYVRLNIRARRR